jgi:hypothetical protein
MLVSVVASRDNTDSSAFVLPHQQALGSVDAALFIETAGSGGHDELVVKINESLSSTVGKIQLNPARDWLQHRTLRHM